MRWLWADVLVVDKQQAMNELGVRGLASSRKLPFLKAQFKPSISLQTPDPNTPPLRLYQRRAALLKEPCQPMSIPRLFILRKGGSSSEVVQRSLLWKSPRPRLE
jgi:hypothetical protein